MDYQLATLIACILWSILSFTSSDKIQKLGLLIIANMFGTLSVFIGYLDSIIKQYFNFNLL